MIKEIPTESKFCVSYGQLKDATGPNQQHLQGTTKEDIVRASLSPTIDLAHHKEVLKLNVIKHRMTVCKLRNSPHPARIISCGIKLLLSSLHIFK
jgi:hypothetical protein